MLHSWEVNLIVYLMESSFHTVSGSRKSFIFHLLVVTLGISLTF